MCTVLAAAGVAIPLNIVNNFPVVDVVIGDKTLPVAFDLGGDNTIELTAELDYDTSSAVTSACIAGGCVAGFCLSVLSRALRSDV